MADVGDMKHVEARHEVAWQRLTYIRGGPLDTQTGGGYIFFFFGGGGGFFCLFVCFVLCVFFLGGGVFLFLNCSVEGAGKRFFLITDVKKYVQKGETILVWFWE